MNLFLYCYEMLQILCFVAALAICFFTYGFTRYRSFAFFGGVLLCCSVEVIYSGIVNLIIGLKDYEALDRAFTIPGALFLLVELLLMQRAIEEACHRRMKYGTPIVFSVLSLAPVISDSVPMLSIGSCSYFLGLVCIAIFYFRVFRKSADESMRPLLDKAAAVLLIGELLACVEMTLYVTVAWRFLDQYLPSYAYGVNFCDFLTSCGLVLLSIMMAARCRQSFVDGEIEKRVREEVALMQAAATAEQEDPIQAFARGYGLTERETEVVECLIRGCSNQEIATELYISVGTVRTHMRNIMEKLEVNARGQVVGMYIAYRK